MLEKRFVFFTSFFIYSLMYRFMWYVSLTGQKGRYVGHLYTGSTMCRCLCLRSNLRSSSEQRPTSISCLIHPMTWSLNMNGHQSLMVGRKTNYQTIFFKFKGNINYYHRFVFENFISSLDIIATRRFWVVLLIFALLSTFFCMVSVARSASY